MKNYYRFIHTPLNNIKWYTNNPQFYYTLFLLLKEGGMSRIKLTTLMFLFSKTSALGKDFQNCKLWEMRDHVFHALLILGAPPLDEDQSELNWYIPYPPEFYAMWPK